MTILDPSIYDETDQHLGGVMDKRPRVAYLDAYNAGSCQGCRARDGMVFEVNANNWITRFCPECLEDIVRQAKRLRRTSTTAIRKGK